MGNDPFFLFEEYMPKLIGHSEPYRLIWQGKKIEEKEKSKGMRAMEIEVNLFCSRIPVECSLEVIDFIGNFDNSTVLSSFLEIEKPIPDDFYSAVVNRYDFLFKAREMLSQIAASSEKSEPLRISIPEPLHKEALTPLSLHSDSNGKLEFRPTPTLQFLIDSLQGVEARRIGDCPICSKIFWRGRTDQRACSPACSHALRNREYRAKYPEDIKQRRIKKAEEKEAAARLALSKKPAKKRKGK